MKRPLLISLGAAAALAATAVGASGPASPSAWIPERGAGGAFVVGKFAPRTVEPGVTSSSDTPPPSPRALSAAPSLGPRPTEIAAPPVGRADTPSATPAPAKAPEIAPQLVPGATEPSDVPKPLQPGQPAAIPTSAPSPTKPVSTNTPLKPPPATEEKPRNTVVDARGSR